MDAARVLAVFLPDFRPEPVEQDLAQLDGRVDVELAAGQRVDLAREPGDLPLHLGAHARPGTPFDLDARALHVGQHLDQRQLDLVVGGSDALLLQARAQRRRQAQDQVRLLGAGLGAAVSTLASVAPPSSSAPPDAGRSSRCSCARSSTATLRRAGFSRNAASGTSNAKPCIGAPKRANRMWSSLPRALSLADFRIGQQRAQDVHDGRERQTGRISSGGCSSGT